MIEKNVRAYLSEVLSPIPVLMERAEEPTEKYVLIEKTGAGRENMIDNATIAIQSYAESLFDAATLNESVKTAMLGDDTNAGFNGTVFSCTLNSDYNFTDTTEKKYRYQAIFDIYY